MARRPQVPTPGEELPPLSRSCEGEEMGNAQVPLSKHNRIWGENLGAKENDRSPDNNDTCPIW